jgi:hypothetical protein
MRASLAAVLLVSCASAASVKEDGTPLRASCDFYQEQIATLEKGATVTIRFAVAGESAPCYKVAVESGGGKLEGFLPGSAIEGLEEFDRARRAAIWLDVARAAGASGSGAEQLPPLPIAAGDPVAASAASLIEAGQPARALELLEPELKKRSSANLLALAGVAAWQSDRGGLAADYLRSALAREPSDPIERLLRHVERETQNDNSRATLVGLRVQLRYEAPAIPDDAARELLEALDDEFSRISITLGCSTGERIMAIAQSPEAYRQTTAAAEWSAGQFDGKIRVPVARGRVDAQLRRTLAHEIAHACISMLGNWPAWLQEGIAQKLSGETPPPRVTAEIAEMKRQGGLPKLAALGRNWSAMDTAHAEVAYGLSLEAVDLFLQEHPAMGLRNLLHNPGQLPSITAELDRKLRAP